MQQPSCPLCGARRSDKVFTDGNYHLRSCHDCNLLFIDPYPSDMAERTRAIVEDDHDHVGVLSVEKHYRAQKIFCDHYFPLIAAECQGAEAFLDVGAGPGALLERMGAEFPEMLRAGVELNAARAEFAQKKAGCEIYQVPVEDLRIDTRFDVIALMNVLSHIAFFERLFSSLRKLLRTDGKLLLKVGEIAKDVQKGDVFDWGIPDHLHFLGIGTIDRICDKYGFEIAKHRQVPVSEELFTRSRFLTPGISPLRNMVKYTLAYAPFALALLRKWYERKHDRRVLSSFIVLRLR